MRSTQNAVLTIRKLEANVIAQKELFNIYSS